jgi:hypothetical protein
MVVIIIVFVIVIAFVVVVIDLEGLLMVERGDAGNVSSRYRHRSRDSRQTEKNTFWFYRLIVHDMMYSESR